MNKSIKYFVIIKILKLFLLILKDIYFYYTDFYTDPIY